ncbi:MAG: glycoside hydrolase family 26 protein [Candidatus Limnocylindrales bacterium]
MASLVLASVSACSTGVTTGGTVPPSGSPTKASPTGASPNPCETAAVSIADVGRLARLGPSSGVWVGLNLDWGAQTVAEVSSMLRSPPAVLVTFVTFPLTAADVGNLEAAVSQVRVAGAALIITLEPWGGLSSVTDEAAVAFAHRLAGYGSQGIPTIVRFAHEMNGTWYPWDQDPVAYVAAFRRVADAVDADAPGAAMLWAPNEGEGYPFAGGPYAATSDSLAARALDTNGDGRLDATDDPYAPYWPGPAYVDWVGMSLYHWGTAYPWGANTVPSAEKFAQLITGTTSTRPAPIPDFYSDYAERFSKPLAIVETSAFYRPGGGGASEAAIKGAWLAQVFSAETRSRFPLLRLVDWFEWRKFETEVHATVDWRIVADPSLRAAFLAAMTDGFHLGPAVPRSERPAGCPTP